MFCYEEMEIFKKKQSLKVLSLVKPNFSTGMLCLIKYLICFAIFNVFNTVPDLTLTQPCQSQLQTYDLWREKDIFVCSVLWRD